MLQSAKLAQVNEAAVAISAAVAHIDRLIDAEPREYPNRPRRKELVKVARTLETQRGILEGLFS